MTDEVLNLSEAERIDFNRRVDIALATVPVASWAMSKRKELDEAIALAVKKSKSYWYLVVGVVGFGIHYFISGNEYKIDFGVYVLLMTAVHWGAGQFDVNRLNSERSRCVERLTALQATWQSSIGNSDDFWSLGNLNVGWRPDWDDDTFTDFWADQTSSILMRVCELKKAREILRQRELERDSIKAYESQRKGEEIAST